MFAEDDSENGKISCEILFVYSVGSGEMSFARYDISPERVRDR